MVISGGMLASPRNPLLRIDRLGVVLAALGAACGGSSRSPEGPTIASVAPSLLCTTQISTTLTVTGEGFAVGSGGGADPAVVLTRTALLDGTPAPAVAVEIPPALVTWDGPTSASVALTPALGLPPGIHALSIRNPDGGVGTAAAAVAAVPPPSVSGASIVLACDGPGLALYVSGTGFLRVDGVAATVRVGDEAGGSRTYAPEPIGCSPLASAVRPGIEVCTGLLVAIGAGDLEPGEWSLLVQNPTPAGCLGTATFDALSAIAGNGWYVDPPVVHVAARTPVAIHLLSTALPFPLAELLPAGGGTPVILSPDLDAVHPRRMLAEVPAGLVAGAWDVRAGDAAGGCTALFSALRVTADASLLLESVDPPIGSTTCRNRVAILSAGGLVPGARAWLLPADGGTAIALDGASVASPTRLEAIVPAGVPPSPAYEVLVVNPDGKAGRLGAAYASAALPPPALDRAEPAFLTPDPSPLVLVGQDFRGPSVELSCLVDEATGAREVLAATVTASTATSVTVAAPPVAALPAPTWCDVRVTNDDGTYTELPGLPLASPDGALRASRSCASGLPAARRAPVLLSAEAEPGARFLYALGGDNGSPAGAASTVYTARVGPRGCAEPLAWFTQREGLGSPRSLAGGAALGRNLYLVGGSGEAPTAAVEGAIVLDPAEAPAWTDLDTTIAAPTGVAGGGWSYRVSAVQVASHPDNPGGESLASEPLPVWLPAGGGRVMIRWTAVAGAAAYRVYRTPGPDRPAAEAELLATIPEPALSYVDVGGATVPGALPLPLGATGRWKALPALGVPREGVAVALARDPVATGTWYLFALGGRSADGPLGTWEALSIGVGAGGRQTPGAAWTAGATTFAPRDGHASFTLDARIVPALGGAAQVLLGPGAGGTAVEGAELAVGGALGEWASVATWPADLSATGPAALGGHVYTIGGDRGGAVADVFAAPASAASPPALGAFALVPGALATARAHPGVVVAGPVVFVAGGVTAAGASASVESRTW